ncbi:tryptophan transporter [Peptacetobacter hominis]|uniref:Tryptophan transporter n=1 Tax=Peptacetobacter hominis TaxID=2743610 RepID=A0A544QYX3_9FIRM|nr:tryptophan transporter [Peptacetobacter hominis]TQQ85825.1 tryptophan transporter [Peptacetobacter hominis]
MKTNTKKMVLNSILLAIGLLLHQLTPALGLPMQPDLALLTMFMIVLLNKDDYKSCLLAGIITGIFAALTTKFPGGQIPNIVDKVISVNFAFIVVYMIFNAPFVKKMDPKKISKIANIAICSLGTLLSGTVFLLVAQYIVGLPAGFSVLFVSIVIPSTIINLIAGIILYSVLSRVVKN